MIHRLMWVYFEVDLIKLVSFMLFSNRCKCYYNEINVKLERRGSNIKL